MQTKEERVAALKDLLPFQRSDFEGLLRAMEGLPVTIRLLDPPLHEFLPDGDMEEVRATPRSRKGDVGGAAGARALPRSPSRSYELALTL